MTAATNQTQWKKNTLKLSDEWIGIWNMERRAFITETLFVSVWWISKKKKQNQEELLIIKKKETETEIKDEKRAIKINDKKQKKWKKQKKRNERMNKRRGDLCLFVLFC